MSDDGSSVFTRYIEDDGPKKESPTEPEIVRRGPQPIIPPAHSKSSPSEKLLAWIVNYWPRPTITLRDIRAFGPNCIRDPADILSLTKTLTEYGWLTPTKAWRRDMTKWRVVREPNKSTQI